MLKEQLKFIYHGGKVKRYHTSDTLTAQTVAEHSFGVAWLCVLLKPLASRELLLAALAHDLGERILGDIPSPAKRLYPDIKRALDDAEQDLLDEAGLDFPSNLTTEELTILKIADIFDGMLFCIRERRMGSKAVIKIYDNFSSYYTDEILYKKGELQEDKPGLELFKIIKQMWSKYNDR